MFLIQYIKGRQGAKNITFGPGAERLHNQAMQKKTKHQMAKLEKDKEEIENAYTMANTQVNKKYIRDPNQNERGSRAHGSASNPRTLE